MQISLLSKEGFRLPETHRPLSRDCIKYLAAFAMLLNHSTYFFPVHPPLLREFLMDIGYFTAVTMCYFLVEGYTYTRSKKGYGIRLFIFALLSQLPFHLAFPSFGFQLNIFFTLLICFLILCCLERMNNPRMRQLACAALILASAFCDWGFLAPVFTLLFANAYGDPRALRKAYLVDYGLFTAMNTAEFLQNMDFASALLRGVLSGVGILLSAFVILHLYSGKRAEHGRIFSKWFFYLFYPVHLMLLVWISACV